MKQVFSVVRWFRCWPGLLLALLNFSAWGQADVPQLMQWVVTVNLSY